jgi:hypothetical protein
MSEQQLDSLGRTIVVHPDNAETRLTTEQSLHSGLPGGLGYD